MKKIVAAVGFACWTMVLGGCVSMKAHVDPTLGYVSEEQKVQIENPQPVQLVFEFQTKGAANARATKQLSDLVWRVVSESNLFSSVSTDPVDGGALLSVTINNIPEENAASKGFGTGLTLGLAASTVSDFYEGSAKYVASRNAPEIKSEKQHAIHSVVGAGASPEGMTPSANLLEAAETMTEQLVQNLINELGKQPEFSGSVSVDEEPVETISSIEVIVELG